jgi:hypothetical protein
MLKAIGTLGLLAESMSYYSTDYTIRTLNFLHSLLKCLMYKRQDPITGRNRDHFQSVSAAQAASNPMGT